MLVVHLDDHQLFTRAMKGVLEKHIPDVQIKDLPDSDKALDYISECLRNKIKIDLIITDYIHSTVNGVIFSQIVREIEALYSLSIPILLNTMVDNRDDINEAVRSGLIDCYLLKSASEDEIINAVNLLCSHA